MKVLQTIAGMSASSGGPSTCTLDLMNALYSINAPVDLLTMSSMDSSDTILGHGQPWLHTVKYDCKKPFMTSRNFDRTIRDIDYDLYHCNGLWMGVNHSTCAIARQKGKKYIISPHGMLYPNALRIHYWKKWVLLNLWYNKDIQECSCMHATCRQEAEFIRKFGYQGPIAVIGNAVVIPDYVKVATMKPKDKTYIGFLGRLHPIKRVERIFYGLALCPKDIRDNVTVLIMGEGDKDYETFLHNEVSKLSLRDNVKFLGFVGGKDKYEKLRKLSALFVPSESENFGMIVPEALICGTPVFASKGTPWEMLNEYKCGWWKEASAENISEIITDIVTMQEHEILNMGQTGREFVSKEFSPLTIAGRMMYLYKWLYTGGTTPDFIYNL